MTRAHVLHLIESLGPGGAERLLHTNLKHFDRAFRHTVVTVSDRGDYWRPPIEALGVEVVSLGCPRYVDVGRGAARFHRLVARVRPDLIHTHLWSANVIGRLVGRSAGLPVLSSIHNPEYEPQAGTDKSASGRCKREIAWAVDLITARIGCTRMVAVSDYVRQSTHHRLRYPLDRIALVYNPVDLEELSTPPARSRSEVLREAGLPPDTLLLLNVARVSPQKGLVHAVRAMAAVAEEFPRARLISIGSKTDATYVGLVEEEVRRLGLERRVLLVGPRRDVPDWLRACDVFVFPSLFEGLGIALCEAMAAGRACVASEVGPVREFFRDGVDGRLVPPGDNAAIQRALCELLAAPEERARLGEAAAKNARSRFEPRAAAQKLETIYRDLLGAA